MPSSSDALPWLRPDSVFPSVNAAQGPHSEAPGLLALGGNLSVDMLQRAYRGGIFPWFSDDQPILWWSPDPRMVLQVNHFRLHRSLRKSLRLFTDDTGCEVRIDTAFEDVIRACAQSEREGQSGTWIVPAMVQAYIRLHSAGRAHSVETWKDGKLIGGLYCVALGHAVFGESMFTRIPDASKIALAALVGFCRAHDVAFIDCQQNTPHLASLGASEIPRRTFLERMSKAACEEEITWRFSPLYWNHVFSD